MCRIFHKILSCGYYNQLATRILFALADKKDISQVKDLSNFTVIRKNLAQVLQHQGPALLAIPQNHLVTTLVDELANLCNDYETEYTFYSKPSMRLFQTVGQGIEQNKILQKNNILREKEVVLPQGLFENERELTNQIKRIMHSKFNVEVVKNPTSTLDSDICVRVNRAVLPATRASFYSC